MEDNSNEQGQNDDYLSLPLNLFLQGYENPNFIENFDELLQQKPQNTPENSLPQNQPKLQNLPSKNSSLNDKKPIPHRLNQINTSQSPLKQQYEKQFNQNWNSPNSPFSHNQNINTQFNQPRNDNNPSTYQNEPMSELQMRLQSQNAISFQRNTSPFANILEQPSNADYKELFSNRLAKSIEKKVTNHINNAPAISRLTNDNKLNQNSPLDSLPVSAQLPFSNNPPFSNNQRQSRSSISFDNQIPNNSEISDSFSKNQQIYTNGSQGDVEQSIKSPNVFYQKPQEQIPGDKQNYNSSNNTVYNNPDLLDLQLNFSNEKSKFPVSTENSITQPKSFLDDIAELFNDIYSDNDSIKNFGLDLGLNSYSDQFPTFIDFIGHSNLPPTTEYNSNSLTSFGFPQNNSFNNTPSNSDRKQINTNKRPINTVPDFEEPSQKNTRLYQNQPISGFDDLNTAIKNRSQQISSLDQTNRKELQKQRKTQQRNQQVSDNSLDMTKAVNLNKLSASPQNIPTMQEIELSERKNSFNQFFNNPSTNPYPLDNIGLQMANGNKETTDLNDGLRSTTSYTMQTNTDSPILPSSNTNTPTIKPQRRKIAHNEIEKRYRSNINNRIKDLKNAVPALLNAKPKLSSKTRTLLGDNENDGDLVFCGDSGLLDNTSVSADVNMETVTKLNKATILGKATEYIHKLRHSNFILKRHLQLLSNYVSQSSPNGHIIVNKALNEINQFLLLNPPTFPKPSVSKGKSKQRNKSRKKKLDKNQTETEKNIPIAGKSNSIYMGSVNSKSSLRSENGRDGGFAAESFDINGSYGIGGQVRYSNIDGREISRTSLNNAVNNESKGDGKRNSDDIDDDSLESQVSDDNSSDEDSDD
ncbi:hypothetical protein BB559_000797 [Furculomyces boomerangus]|uniref:BHLH domain-containing protein n=1 Tax=Furculomyces boomerangus TaxID=61424 RepID=A0A2T9Z420_9FUNG|nr:hypothetical protein BB559_000797 [Furculomyces boomerangus]